MPSIQTAVLASHWGTSAAYVRQLRTRKDAPALPDFEDLGETHTARFRQADEWRRIYAPPRKRRAKPPPPSSSDAADKVAVPWGGGGADPSTRASLEQAAAADVGDFDVWMIDSAERIVKEQLALYSSAVRTADLGKIASALDNWQEAARRCAEIRERFQKIREKAAGIISIDRARDIAGREMGRLQELLDTLPERWGPRANPEAPAAAVAVLEAAIAELYTQLANVTAGFASAAPPEAA